MVHARLYLYHYALYRLGYTANQLFSLADDYWMGARLGQPFPNALEHGAAEAVVAAETAMAEKPDSPAAALVGRIGKAAWSSLEELRSAWLGAFHLHMIEFLAKSENAGVPLPEDWDRVNSPLKLPVLMELKQTLAELKTHLATEEESCLTTGGLVAQVLNLGDFQTEQVDIRGERFPIAVLRQKLTGLRGYVSSLADLNIEIPEVYGDAGTSCTQAAKCVIERIHLEIQSRLTVPSPTSPSGFISSTAVELDHISHDPPATQPSFAGDGNVGDALRDASLPISACEVEDAGCPKSVASSDGRNVAIQPTSNAETYKPRAGKKSGSKPTRGKIKEPSEDAFRAYRFRAFHLTYRGPTTQTQLAEALSKELRRPICQGQVSRWLQEVREYLDAGNTLPDLESREKPKIQTIDSARLGLGARQDGRRARPSEIADDA